MKDGGDVTMARKRRVAWWAATAAMASWATAFGAEVRLWPTATVTADEVRLADVAELRGFDAPLAQRLSGINVFAAPRPGGEVLVRADDLRGALAEAGANLSEINLIGAAGCHVARPRRTAPPAASARRLHGKPVGVRRPARKTAALAAASRPEPADKNTLEAALRQYIAARFPEPQAKLSVRFSPTSARDLRLAGASDRFEIRPRDDRRLGLISFEVSVRGDETRRRPIPIVAEIAMTRDVVVARRPVNRGQTIEGRDLRLEEREFTDFDSVGLTEITAAVGQSARDFIKPGEMLLAKSIESKPLVTRGQAVTIWMRRASVVIKASGRAQSAGALGESIEVLRDGTKRKSDLIQATVTGPATVALDRGAMLAMGEEAKR